MIFRARLSVFALEQRENPSVPALDPIGGDAPPPVAPPAPPVIVTIIDAGGATGGGVTTPTTPITPTPPTDPLLGNNGIYNIPLIP